MSRRRFILNNDITELYENFIHIENYSKFWESIIKNDTSYNISDLVYWIDSNNYGNIESNNWFLYSLGNGFNQGGSYNLSYTLSLFKYNAWYTISLSDDEPNVYSYALWLSDSFFDNYRFTSYLNRKPELIGYSEYLDYIYLTNITISLRIIYYNHYNIIIASPNQDIQCYTLF